MKMLAFLLPLSVLGLWILVASGSFSLGFDSVNKTLGVFSARGTILFYFQDSLSSDARGFFYNRSRPEDDFSDPPNALTTLRGYFGAGSMTAFGPVSIMFPYWFVFTLALSIAIIVNVASKNTAAEQ